MPNLDYDPKNPSDLLGRPISTGDVVAWGTTYGKSAALCIAEIVDIVFMQRTNSWGDAGKKCEPALADMYKLRLRPLKSTGDVTWVLKETGREKDWRDDSIPDQRDAPELYEAKTKLVTHVKNVVLMEPIA